MANRSYVFEITWTWSEQGNRPENIEEITEVKSTTVPRAISKLVRELHADIGSEDEPIKAKDIFVIDVRNHKLTTSIIEHKRANGQPDN